MKPEPNFALQLRSFLLTLQSALDDALRETGITSAQMSVLEALVQEPGASSADLARICGVTAQTMHGIVLNLEANGLLVREPHRVHGRILRTYLSNAAHSKLEAGRRAVAEVEERMLATVSQPERDELVGLLARCHGAIARS